MKRVIVIRGSEDGIIGVATNLKRAIEILQKAGYVTKSVKPYQEALKYKKGQGKNWHYINVDCVNGCHVDLYRMDVNQ